MKASLAAAPLAVIREDRTGRWLWFDRPQRILCARHPDQVRETLRATEQATRAGQWAVGFIAYEAAPAFDAALTVRPDRGFPVAWFALCDPPRVAPLPAPTDSGRLAGLRWRASLNYTAFTRALARIHAALAQGATYQVNFTHRLRAACAGDAWPLFLELAAAQNPPLGAYVDAGDWALCSVSPELFLCRTGTRVESRPMKGTRPRGPDAARDRVLARALRTSEKERAENVMIVDMVRNDLGRVARAGAVRVPRLFATERFASVWQMTSTVVARTDADAEALLAATFPPASITGAPKAATMALIADLETAPRRAYTGAIGFLAPRRRLQLNVGIRTLLVDRRRGRAEYGVGGGIVWDSEPAREWAECHAKAAALHPPPPFELLETLLWTPTCGYRLLTRHLDRLDASARHFGFPAPRRAALAALRNCAATASGAPRRVRLLVARTGAVRIECAPLTDLPTPYRVALDDRPVAPDDPFLRHKTTWRSVYDAARARHPEADDVILVNAQGAITESTLANVIVAMGGRLYTPPVGCGLLPGTARAEWLARGRGRERVITAAELRAAERVWLINSVRGRWPVRVEG